MTTKLTSLRHQEIAPGVHSIGQTGRRAYISGYSHAYLLEDEATGTLTLIDALADPDAHLVLDRIKAIGRSIEDLEHILLSHGHRSHIGGAARLKSLSGATVHSHEWEAGIIAGERPALPVFLRPLFPVSLQPMRLGAALGFGGAETPCPVDHHLEDGDQVGSVQVIHTPGHTLGHLAFYWPEREALFPGDYIATWPTLSAGWRGFQLDEGQFWSSLRRMAEIASPVAAIAVSHGDPILKDAASHLSSLVGDAPA